VAAPRKVALACPARIRTSARRPGNLSAMQGLPSQRGLARVAFTISAPPYVTWTSVGAVSTVVPMVNHVQAQDLEDRYRHRWLALSNTTLGVFMAMVNSSIVLVSLPAIFRGIRLDPLEPANVSYLLWMLMGYLLVTAVLVVAFGRVGDMFGRVRMYNAGFLVFTLASVALGFVPGDGPPAALALIVLRMIQGVGGALLMANSVAILTDAFPPGERGLALGLNQVAALAGSFVGLVAGGLLADWHWRAVFWVSVPVGLLGTVWAYAKLKDLAQRVPARLDWAGNISFGAGLTLVLLATTYGIQPGQGRLMSWTTPIVLIELLSGTALLVLFVWIEGRVRQPMFALSMFKLRAFAAGNLANLLASVARGGLQFMLILWLQGIWLPLHGYSFESTPLWAGIYMLPLTLGFLLAGPLSGFLSDRFGARAFATGGLILGAFTYVALAALPVDFSYPAFAAVIFLNGVGSGLFASPNTSAIMSSVEPWERGAASGMRATFQNAGMVLSLGIFFSVLIAGLALEQPAALRTGLLAHHVPFQQAQQVASLPPVGTLFAAFLGENPLRQMLGPHILSALSRRDAAALVGKTFFPGIMASPFKHGLLWVFGIAVALQLVAALASALRGREAIRAPRAHRVDKTRSAEA